MSPARMSLGTLTVGQRLGLTCAAAALLLLSLAYWWLGNLAHEIFGTGLFLALVWHIAGNKAWFVRLARGRYDAWRVIVTVLHAALAANMLVLLATSLLVSKRLYAALHVSDAVILSEIHWFSAYWVMIAVGVHLGVHWSRVLRMVGLAEARVGAVWTLRLLAAAAALFGLWSWSVLGVGTKLTFGYSLDFWDFKRSVTPFFGHWAGVIALPTVITHYALMGLRRR